MSEEVEWQDAYICSNAVKPKLGSMFESLVMHGAVVIMTPINTVSTLLSADLMLHWQSPETRIFSGECWESNGFQMVSHSDNSETARQLIEEIHALMVMDGVSGEPRLWSGHDPSLDDWKALSNSGCYSRSSMNGKTLACMTAHSGQVQIVDGRVSGISLCKPLPVAGFDEFQRAISLHHAPSVNR